jgi:hypothetical protein
MMMSRGRHNRSYHSPSFTLSEIFQLPDAFPVLKPKKINMMRAFAEDAKMSKGGNIVSGLPGGSTCKLTNPKTSSQTSSPTTSKLCRECKHL